MTVYLAPGPFGCGGQFFTNGGLPLKEGLIYTYEAGTTTPKATYTMRDGMVQNANPIELDATGRPPQEIWLLEDAYDFDLHDALDNPIRTYQDIGGILDAATLAAPGGSDLIGFLQAGSGAVARTAQSKMRDLVSVKDFGAVGDGATNDSSFIQAAIDSVSASGGGNVWFPAGTYKCNVTLKDGVMLVGTMGGYGYLAGSVYQSKLVANSTGVVIDTPVSQTISCGAFGINIQGLGAGTACVGLRLRDVSYGQFKNLNIYNFADQGILVDSGSIACTFEDMLVYGCLLNQSRAAKIGTVDVDGTDHFFSRMEVSGSQSAASSANLYLCAWVLRGDVCFLTNCIGEIADEGFHLVNGSTLHRFLGCRADLNFGNGFNVGGASNVFDSCLSLNNSQETTNTYDNWVFQTTSGNCLTQSCQSVSNIAKVARYGFNDLLGSISAANWHSNVKSFGSGTAEYKNENTAGAAFAFGPQAGGALTQNSATPSVLGLTRCFTNNNSSTTITNFTNGVSGQEIYVLCGDANTTIQHNGSTISTSSGVSITCAAGTTYHGVKYGALWRFNG